MVRWKQNRIDLRSTTSHHAPLNTLTYFLSTGFVNPSRGVLFVFTSTMSFRVVSSVSNSILSAW